VAEHIREVVSCTHNDDYFDCAAYNYDYFDCADYYFDCADYHFDCAACDCDYYDYFDCADYYFDCADYHDYYFTCCGPCVGWVCWLFGWQVLGWF
jgi:hypothetical protein